MAFLVRKGEVNINYDQTFAVGPIEAITGGFTKLTFASFVDIYCQLTLMLLMITLKR